MVPLGVVARTGACRCNPRAMELTCAPNDGCSPELAVAVLQAVQKAIHDRALLRHDARASARATQESDCRVEEATDTNGSVTSVTPAAGHRGPAAAPHGPCAVASGPCVPAQRGRVSNSWPSQASGRSELVTMLMDCTCQICPSPCSARERASSRSSESPSHCRWARRCQAGLEAQR